MRLPCIRPKSAQGSFIFFLLVLQRVTASGRSTIGESAGAERISVDVGMVRVLHAVKWSLSRAGDTGRFWGRHWNGEIHEHQVPLQWPEAQLRSHCGHRCVLLSLAVMEAYLIVHRLLSGSDASLTQGISCQVADSVLNTGSFALCTGMQGTYCIAFAKHRNVVLQCRH